jgi:predicted nucleotidyltransferase
MIAAEHAIDLDILGVCRMDHLDPRVENDNMTEGVTLVVARAIEMFSERATAEYGHRLVKLLMFGSRARHQATRDSDIDVAVVLDVISDVQVERNRLSDIAYDVIVETKEEVQPWPISAREWDNPQSGRNPIFIRAVKRDGIEIVSKHDSRPVYQSL